MAETKYDARFLSGDELWDGAEPGWYWGEVTDDDELGDTVGPFGTEAECRTDMAQTMG